MEEFAQFMQMYMKVVQASANELTDQEAQVIENFIREALKFIGKSKLAEEEMPVQAPVPEVPQAQMPSSNVYGFNFDKGSGKLLVKFQGNDGLGQGPVYEYEGVPPIIFELFKKGAIPARTDGENKWGRWWKGKVPSLGASLYTLIKNGGFPYQRVA